MSSFHFIDARAELGSRPSEEGPMDPNGPTEYTEQTLDADSQVGVLTIFYFGVISSLGDTSQEERNLSIFL